MNGIRPIRFLCAALSMGLVVLGCAQLRPYRTPTDIPAWQPTDPPKLSIDEKARVYRTRAEQWHRLPDGMIRYRVPVFAHDDPTYRSNHADGAFYQGIYLAIQALRLGKTGESSARRELLAAIEGAERYLAVSGKRGLLARYYDHAPAEGDPRWLPSPTVPGYFWRSDVSKDQYAGFIHGLGVTLALVPDPEIRARVGAMARAIADHLIENDMRIIDVDGERTTHGDLRARIFGVPIGVNALISLAIARTAASAGPEARYREFHARLVERGYPEAAHWAHVSIRGYGNRVNDNMAYLALVPLLLLEQDPEILATLRAGARRSWRTLRHDRNGFVAFIHAALIDDRADEPGGMTPSAIGRRALAEFPDRKLSLPVDLTREGFDFPRASFVFKTSKGTPRSTEAIPLYLRPRGSSMWVSDPFRLVGALRRQGQIDFNGFDYLQAYWIARHYGLLEPSRSAGSD